MERDFTLRKYKELLIALGPGDFSLKNYFNNNEKYAIIRHDVDRPPENVLAMAKLEHELGIKSTYFFRIKEKLFIENVISCVMELGHEVGYHYEVLDKAKGDYTVAIKIFEDEWNIFKKWNSETICMHGNPLSKFNNRDIWMKYDFKDYVVIGEAYLSVDFSKYKYFTDTGRKWNSNSFSVKDKIGYGLINIRKTDEIISLIKSGKLKRVYLLTHPSKWNDDYIPWFKEFVFQNIKNIGKACIRKF